MGSAASLKEQVATASKDELAFALNAVSLEDRARLAKALAAVALPEETSEETAMKLKAQELLEESLFDTRFEAQQVLEETLLGTNGAETNLALEQKMDSITLTRVDGSDLKVDLDKISTVLELQRKARDMLGAKGVGFVKLISNGETVDTRKKISDVIGSSICLVVQEEPPIETIKEAFDFVDDDGSGIIDVRKLKSAMIVVLGEQPTKSTLCKLIANNDPEGNGTIDFESFLKLMQSSTDDEDERRLIHGLLHSRPGA